MPTPVGNFIIKALINSPLHPLQGESFAFIALTGRKTGKSITTPINTVLLDIVSVSLSDTETIRLITAKYGARGNSLSFQ
jgi:hypothetical protein